MKNSDAIIIGAGLAGLCAAITLAEAKKKVTLISQMPSERAQSVMAEGGINGALDTKGEHDSTEDHFVDTMKAGVDLANREAVHNMTKEAPHLIHWLHSLGVEFNMDENKNLDVRFFGGQKKRRTAFAGNCTGKQIMTSLIQEARKYENQGYINRLSHHTFAQLVVEEGTCVGCIIRDEYTNELDVILGQVILASGGMNGLFGKTTGSILNTGVVTAKAFVSGAELANVEMIQYHPTTCIMNGKRGLISEAVRGEGGRLFTYDHGEKYYFMEDRYPELKNLMPRDVVSREIWKVCREQQTDHVYLDMTGISESIFQTKLAELVEMTKEYLNVNPRKDYLEVYPGIHYFMGGMYVDVNHKTTIHGLYAAGECACQYHGANRLGGNSLLGAVYGGIVAANSVIQSGSQHVVPSENLIGIQAMNEYQKKLDQIKQHTKKIDASQMQARLVSIMNHHMGIVRNGKDMQVAFEEIEQLRVAVENGYDESVSVYENEELYVLILLAQAVVQSGIARKESRGAHTRNDFPERDPFYQKTTVASYHANIISVRFDAINKE